MEIAKRGAKVALTEINKPMLSYTRTTHCIDVYEFYFNKAPIYEVVPKCYDMIFVRLAILFYEDLEKFLRDLLN